MADMVKQLAAWQSGIAHELSFWEAIVAARGGPFDQDFAYRLNPDGGMDHAIGNEIRTAAIGSARILDVGSGPLTKIGKVFRGERPSITATDPLAVFYADILTRNSVQSLVPVQTAFAEDLSAHFQPSTFDVTVCINALDHSFDPARALLEMVEVTKMGGAIVLQHRVNEAEHEQYVGLHQWNFDSQSGGRFVIWNKIGFVDVQSLLANCARVTRVDVKNDTITVVIRRTGFPGVSDPARHRARIGELLSAFVSLAAGPPGEAQA